MASIDDLSESPLLNGIKEYLFWGSDINFSISETIWRWVSVSTNFSLNIPFCSKMILASASMFVRLLLLLYNSIFFSISDNSVIIESIRIFKKWAVCEASKFFVWMPLSLYVVIIVFRRSFPLCMLFSRMPKRIKFAFFVAIYISIFLDMFSAASSYPLK